MIDDTHTGVTYQPEVSNERVGGHEYALIVYAVSPYKRTRQILVLAGCHDVGTWAATLLALSPEFARLPLVRSGRSFEALLKTEVVEGIPLGITIVDIRALAEPAPLPTAVTAASHDGGPDARKAIA